MGSFECRAWNVTSWIKAAILPLCLYQQCKKNQFYADKFKTTCQKFENEFTLSENVTVKRKLRRFSD